MTRRQVLIDLIDAELAEKDCPGLCGALVDLKWVQEVLDAAEEEDAG